MQPKAPSSLRVVTLNFWGTEPPLAQRLALAVRQLRELDPDVVCLQECRPLDGAEGETTADVMARELGLTAHYATSVRWDAGVHGLHGQAGQEGLAILARGIRETREHQVLAIDAAIRACGRGNDDSPQILCGDMNATPDSDEMRFLRGLTTLAGRRTHFQDAWLRHHREVDAVERAGITWSSENELTRPLRSLDIDRRIDFVYVTSRKKDGRATVHACDVVLRERDASGICASDHYGVAADVQVVANS